MGALGVVFAVLVVAVTLQSRREIRQQILDRDGEVLAAVAQMLQTTHYDLEGEGLPALDIALQTSYLRGVMAVRLFDADGYFTFAIPFDVNERALRSDEVATLKKGEPIARFEPESRLADIFELLPPDAASGAFPIQDIVIPLFDPTGSELAGSVQYLIDGKPLQQELAALDRTLILQASTALAIGIGALILLAGLAFIQLSRSHRELADRTRRLAKANQELALAARTSAVGAVTSHLIHGIRNPLTGLDLFFQTRNTDELPGQSPESWRQLAEATNRIRELVDEVVEVLREQETTTAYELSLKDFESVLQQKLKTKTAEAGIEFTTQRTGDGMLSGHAANILLLIVINLVDNALSVTPAGKGIWVEIQREGDIASFEIGDQGPGVPEEMRENLFTPGKSGRPGGTGLGLAISHRLAVHIDASLDLARSDEEGTVFLLRCPLTEDLAAHSSKAG